MTPEQQALRDEYAMAAMPAIAAEVARHQLTTLRSWLLSVTDEKIKQAPIYVASMSYMIADAMLKARERT